VTLAACGGGTPSTGAAVRTTAHPVSLPSDGWRPGDPGLLALTTGPFHAVLTAEGACAWLGSIQTPYLWPAGYKVRFDPTELINAQGHVTPPKVKRSLSVEADDRLRPAPGVPLRINGRGTSSRAQWSQTGNERLTSSGVLQRGR